MKRLLDHVDFADSGDPHRRQVLGAAIEAMLLSPTARELADRFVEEGGRARLCFAPVVGSRLCDVGGRRIFFGARGFSSRRNGLTEITFNADYLAGDAELRAGDLPFALAHELLGHGLWEARAERAGVIEALRHHDLNEINARLVGWLVDLESDGRLEMSGASHYLADPDGYRAHLKLINSYYALTFSSAEMGRIDEVMESRLAASRADLEDVADRLANRAPNPPAQDEEDDLRDRDAALREIIEALGGALERCRAEPDRTSVKYFRHAATHPIFAQLEREVERRAGAFRDLVARRKFIPGLGTPR